MRTDSKERKPGQLHARLPYGQVCNQRTLFCGNTVPSANMVEYALVAVTSMMKRYGDGTDVQQNKGGIPDGMTAFILLG